MREATFSLEDGLSPKLLEDAVLAAVSRNAQLLPKIVKLHHEAKESSHPFSIIHVLHSTLRHLTLELTNFPGSHAVASIVRSISSRSLSLKALDIECDAPEIPALTTAHVPSAAFAKGSLPDAMLWL